MPDDGRRACYALSALRYGALTGTLSYKNNKSLPSFKMWANRNTDNSIVIKNDH